MWVDYGGGGAKDAPPPPPPQIIGAPPLDRSKDFLENKYVNSYRYVDVH